ncbi:type 1 glutamine amidotransferase [Thermoleophilum album]|uniref:type 1 glutamine amidotransferase n=1 Tax=Thermoleophilum album TaxID=29539 RepID=UPI00237D00C6|nr:type 1 glutamine amidotransferase [Thermoleophilum album]WDT93165.1 type 1 glutamine amidotransferase [Thermoleophilum album]
MASVAIVRHVPWEGPHRIARCLDEFDLIECEPLDGLAQLELAAARDAVQPHGHSALPDPERLAGVVVMGGPMSANDDRRLPGLAAELRWIERVVAAGVPYLGVCLGSQLLARAAGASVRPGNEPEIGFAEITVTAAGEGDPLLRHLAPRTVVLHWHGEIFDLPSGAASLACSELTEHQAFRLGDNAWGVLFHAEADSELVAAWLDEPLMRREARDALGDGFADRLRADAAAHSAQLRERADRMFGAFADRCRERARALA